MPGNENFAISKRSIELAKESEKKKQQSIERRKQLIKCYKNKVCPRCEATGDMIELKAWRLSSCYLECFKCYKCGLSDSF